MEGGFCILQVLQLEGGAVPAVPAVRMRCVGSRLRVPAAPVEE